MSNVTFLEVGRFDVSREDVDAAVRTAGSAHEAIRRLLIANADLERRLSRVMPPTRSRMIDLKP